VEKVGIVSYGILPYKGQKGLGMWNDEATFQVAKQALDKVGLTADALDTVILSTMDGLDGITISNALLAPAAGGYKKESTRIETTGGHCAISGIAGILSGSADIVMVASSDTIGTDFNYVTNTIQDSHFRAPLGFNHAQSFGMLATEYLKRMDVTEDDFALAASKNYLNGAKNPWAHVKEAYSVDDIKSSQMVSWPLREREIAGTSNGAVAIILASEKKARELTDNPIWVTGVGAGVNPYLGGWEELSEAVALQKAVQKAYKTAGIQNPKEELDFIEISNPFSAFEIMAYECLGICEKGKGAELLRDGTTSLGGSLPVNISGGSLSTNGLNSSGIFRMIQAMMILNNEMEGVDLGSPKRGLVHDSDMSIGAVGGDSHAVLIMEKES
jgi:acetyl-CoA C-acetyltransferase